ncbi:MAG: hypothetical protein LWY06_03500 [Firmicutes bacterium]|nr:hypothetical protein [Bacillota bacterium]
MPQSDASVKFLIDKLNDTKTEQGLREMMAARLSDFQRPEATAFFEKHLTDPNKGVKIYAMSYLARLSYKTYRTRIKEMMKDPDSDVSQAAENTIDMFDQMAENPDAKDGINENDPYKIIKGMPGSQEENEK